ncbi:hypothetical protein Btru_016394 [Bulinus truncatus]|nr:hypothetical protein Btru_016394 [Bulinus truncatus]
MEVIRCARLYNAKDLRLEDTPLPVPGPQQVQIKVAYVGICATDVQFYDQGKVDRYILTRPTILGHEISGVVSQLGSEVTSLNVFLFPESY